LGNRNVRGGKGVSGKPIERLENEKEVFLDSISEHVVYQDLDSRVLWVNRAAADSAGQTPKDLVGRFCYEIWQQRSTPCPNCPVVKAKETGKPQEKEMTTPDGRSWFIRGYPIRNEKGETIAAAEVALDITERRKAEEALRQKLEELERMNRLMVGRELRMRELKKEIKKLKAEKEAK